MLEKTKEVFLKNEDGRGNVYMKKLKIQVM